MSYEIFIESENVRRIPSEKTVYVEIDNKEYATIYPRICSFATKLKFDKNQTKIKIDYELVDDETIPILEEIFTTFHYQGKIREGIALDLFQVGCRIGNSQMQKAYKQYIKKLRPELFQNIGKILNFHYQMKQFDNRINLDEDIKHMAKIIHTFNCTLIASNLLETDKDVVKKVLTHENCQLNNADTIFQIIKSLVNIKKDEFSELLQIIPFANLSDGAANELKDFLSDKYENKELISIIYKLLKLSSDAHKNSLKYAGNYLVNNGLATAKLGDKPLFSFVDSKLTTGTGSAEINIISGSVIPKFILVYQPNQVFSATIWGVDSKNDKIKLLDDEDNETQFNSSIQQVKLKDGLNHVKSIIMEFEGEISLYGLDVIGEFIPKYSGIM